MRFCIDIDLIFLIIVWLIVVSYFWYLIIVDKNFGYPFYQNKKQSGGKPK